MKYPDDFEQTRWLTQTKMGETFAFNKIIEKYQTPIYNLCYRKLGNANDAEDATQEIFLRAYMKLDSYDNNRQFSPWLFAIASNYCNDALKKAQRRVIWERLDDTYHYLPAANKSPETAVLDRENQAVLHNLIRTLPLDYRKAVVFKYWHALSCRDIAQQLDTSVSGIKSKLFRARKHLGEAII